MISINKQGNAIVIEFTDNDKYLFNGKIEVAPNELIVVVDQSDMVTFKRASNGDVLFSQLVDDIQIAGSPVTKDTVIDQFALIGFTSGGGGGAGGAVSSVNGQTGDVIITPASLNVYTRAEVDDAINAETTERQKQDSALGGMIAAETAARERAVATKQDTLVSGTNIKTINGQSVLGAGNIEIQGGGGGIADAPSDDKLYGRKNSQWTEIPSTDNLATKEELNAKANLDGANFTGGVVVPDLSINNSTKGVMFNVSNQSNDILFRTLNAGIDSVSFQVQNAYPLKLTEAGIMENNQLLENKYAKIDDIPTKVSDLENDSGFITNTEASNSYQAKGDYATTEQVNSKQDTLISGTNIKTVNGQTLLGEGNIEIQGGGTITVDSELSTTSENPVQNKVITNAINGKQDAGDYALKSEIPDTSELATKEELAAKLDIATYNSEKANFALKSELPDTSTLATKSEVTSGLATKLDVATYNADKPTFALKTEIPDISGLATKTELSGKLDTATYNSEKASFETKENAAATYQVKGDYATTAQLNSKQDTLVSGTNIKTINGNSLLGEGDITIQAGGTVDTAMSDTSENAVQNKVIKKYIDDLVGNILTQLQEINGTN